MRIRGTQFLSLRSHTSEVCKNRKTTRAKVKMAQRQLSDKGLSRGMGNLRRVGGGEMPRYPPNKVMIWDDHQNRNIGELKFRSPVKAVKLRRDRVVVVLECKIYVYNFHDLKLIDCIDTIQNPLGLCALCPNTNNTVLACPGPESKS